MDSMWSILGWIAMMGFGVMMIKFREPLAILMIESRKKIDFKHNTSSLYESTQIDHAKRSVFFIGIVFIASSFYSILKSF